MKVNITLEIEDHCQYCKATLEALAIKTGMNTKIPKGYKLVIENDVNMHGVITGHHIALVECQ